MTVREAMLKVSDDEFNWWRAYDRVQPIGGKRFDNLNAILCTVIASANSSSKKYKVEDFMPRWGESGKKTGAEMEAMFRIHVNNNNKKFQE